VKYNTVNVVDLESTCDEIQDSSKSEIIEIGIVEVNLHTFEIDKKRSIYVKPLQASITKFCYDLTGISQELIDTQGISLSRAFDTLKLEYNSENRLWFSFGDYDKNMLMQESRKKSLIYPMYKRHLNIKTLTSVFESFPKEESLKGTLEKLNMKFIGKPHSGADDAYNTARILIYLLKKYKGLPFNK
jgi:inhibitor of KinA sporulation pathway (predicted exonuclease)